MSKETQWQWVEIERVLLTPQQRADHIPDDTKAVPLTMRAAGFLLDASAAPGDKARIQTPAGRIWEGTLLHRRVQPSHGFGAFLPELQAVGPTLRRALKGDGEH